MSALYWTLTLCPARPYSCEPGETLIGATLSMKYGASGLTQLRKTWGKRVCQSQASSPLHFYVNQIDLSENFLII